IISFFSVDLYTRYTNHILGMKAVIVFFSLISIVFGVIIWFVIKDSMGKSIETSIGKVTLEEIVKVLKMPSVWAVALIVLLAYTSHRNTDFLTPYLTKICGVNTALGALLSTIRFYSLRPIGSVVAGFVADRISVSKTMIYIFIIMIVTNVLYIILPGNPNVLYFVVTNMVVLMIACFAAKGIYYALLEEGKIPMAFTGTAVGVISTISYTPDIFAPLLGGYFLDLHSGVKGYNYIFLLSAISAALGIIAILWFRKSLAKSQ
ncbi:MAG: hypothetical protein ACPLTR_08885, partial [Thermacetogeniaceae bacterium]